jgi:uncharacterized protein YceK
MKRAVVGWLVVVLALTPTGCGTVINLTRTEPEQVPEAERFGHDSMTYRPGPLEVYGGLKYHFLDPDHEESKWGLELRQHSNSSGLSAVGFLIGFVAVELPLCFVADTLLLPITVPATLRRENASATPAAETAAEVPVTPSSPRAPSPPAPAPPGCPAT